MVNLFVLVLCFALGIGLRAAGRLPVDAHRTLNAFVVNVALPALVLRHVHALRYDGQLLLPAIMPWLLFGASTLFFAVLGRVAGWSRRTTGGLILSGGLANTSFMGLPMIEAFYGPAFLGVGILVDQLGSYMALSTAGVMVAAVYAESGPASPAALARKVAIFPPFQALVLALLLIPVDYPEPVVAVLDRLGATLTPVALISVGCQLRLGWMRDTWRPLSVGLLYKLVLGPAIVAALLILGLHAGGTMIQVTVFEAAMGPMIGGSIVAMENDLDPRLVSLMVGLGIPLSLLTAAAWSVLLGGV
jgi:malate permease and related proteins